MKITVQRGDLTAVAVDAIVNAANSQGIMGGGVAGAIRSKGGAEIERQAISKAPIPVGEAVITTAGKLPCKHVIHAPTMERPAMATTTEKVAKATRAALRVAEENKLQRIAIPGMGTGVGRVPVEEAAHAIVKTVREFKPKHLKEVILMDRNEEMVEAFRRALGEKEIPD